ncbi:hypothetical protein ACH437_31145 [Streptomyces xinghaiensis]|uniref:hypothetical protein n=1 Tax=Streptomyces xinghaiensis TaxID=1038928 RepID=UPI0037A4846D
MSGDRRRPSGLAFSSGDRRRIDSIGLSRISYHSGACCSEGRSFVLRRFDRWFDMGSRLAAIPLVVAWGPTRWPTHWCRLAESDELVGDCGVHADLAGELLTLAGVPYARGRAALRPTVHAAPHWRSTWSESDADDTWIGDDVVHHEVLRIGARWWDPTEARWFAGPGSHVLAGQVVAVREEGTDWQPGAPIQRSRGDAKPGPCRAGTDREGDVA